MAKKNKKPNHARLVVPGVSGAPAGKAPRRQKAAKPPKAQKAAEARTGAADNTIDLARDGEAVRKNAAKRRKRRHRLQLLLLVAVFVGVLLLYFSGVYRTAVLKGTDLIEGIRLSIGGSGSFPLSFDVSGYVESDNLGSNGIAVLGEKDMAIVSADGRELYRFQHGYGNPHITASNTRVCVYNRGGTEYTIEGRSDRITSRTTERDILFAEMSPNGALALATTSRFRSVVQIYSNFADDEPQFQWEITDETPYAASFMSDNKHMALACVSTEGGAIHSNIYLLHINRSEVQATINGGGATVLAIEYLAQNRILVIYDSYAALYNAEGVETARYDYAGQDIAAVHSQGGTTALVFSAVSNNRVNTVLLDSTLAVTATLSAETAETPRVLVGGKTVYLLTGYDVAAYATDGTLLQRYTGEYKGYALQWAGARLRVTGGSVEDLGWMTQEDATPPGQESATGESLAEDEGEALPGDGDGAPAAQSGSADDNAAGAESRPASAPPESETTGGVEEDAGDGEETDNGEGSDNVEDFGQTEAPDAGDSPA